VAGDSQDRLINGAAEPMQAWFQASALTSAVTSAASPVRQSADPVQEIARFASLGRRPRQSQSKPESGGEPMPQSKKCNPKQTKMPELPILNPTAAGIDIGATEIYIAVHPDCDPEPVRSFAAFTEDLHRLAD
jgi:hypothetical protein